MPRGVGLAKFWLAMRPMIGGLALSLSTVVAKNASSQESGGGISSGLVGGVSGGFVREHWGLPDSTRLIAAVLFRGQPMAGVTRAGPETELARAMMDSLSKDAMRRGVWAGGSVTPFADQWIEFDPKSHTLRTLGRTWNAFPRDSILVVLVDHLDRAGGDATISTLSVFCPPDLDASRQPGADLMEALLAQSRRWQAVLMADPTIQRFASGERRP